jgi:hypothetical protein
MKLRLILTIAAFILALPFLNAQKLIVEYDYLEDNINYYKLKKSGEKIAIPSASVQRNHQVKV